jgi:hypothetical protein
MGASDQTEGCETCQPRSSAGRARGACEFGCLDEPEPTPYVYAMGAIEARFPSLSVEKEFAQATGRGDTAGLADRAAFRSTLSQRSNRYLVRKLCWVLVVDGLDTYLLSPRSGEDLDLLVAAIRPEPKLTDVDVVIGVRGPLAGPEDCNGLMLPTVTVDQVYSFDQDELLSGIPRPDATGAAQSEQFRSSAAEVFLRILHAADNAGGTDEHRALNYLAVRYPAIYATAADRHQHDFSFRAVDVRPTRRSGPRSIVDVVLSFANRSTDVNERYFARVDVTEEFPFLVTKLSPYYDH